MNNTFFKNTGPYEISFLINAIGLKVDNLTKDKITDTSWTPKLHKTFSCVRNLPKLSLLETILITFPILLLDINSFIFSIEINVFYVLFCAPSFVFVFCKLWYAKTPYLASSLIYRTQSA